MEIATFRDLVARAHEGQVDKAGKPYLGHVTRAAAHAAAILAALPPGAVSDGEAELVEFVALGHDLVEDTAETEDTLRAAGVPERAIAGILRLSKNDWPGTYQEYIEDLASGDGLIEIVAKLGDNADNHDPERIAQLPPAQRSISNRYGRAAKTLRAGLDRIVAARLAVGSPEPWDGGDGASDAGDWIHPGPFVFVVTVFTRVKPRFVAIQVGPERGTVREVNERDHRTWGWFQTAEGAERALRINDGDMHETIYDLAVIERTGEGAMATVAGESWWSFDLSANGGRGGYVPAERPADFECVVGFGMG